MGTTSEKLTYLNTTKSKIKDSINLTGANILSTDTFRSYATKLKNGLVDIINNGIDTLYDNFPKVTAEGTEIVLNNTYEAPLKVNAVKGDTTQTTYSGKNLLKNAENTINLEGVDIQILNNGTKFIFNGTASARKTSVIDNTTNVPSEILGQTYSASYNVSNTTNAYVFWVGYVDTNNTNHNTLPSMETGNLTGNVKIENKTFPNDAAKYRTVIGVVSGQVYNNFVLEVQIEKNTSATSYEPYVGGIASPNPDYPQEVKVVTGLQNVSVSDGTNTTNYEVNLGKNLYNSNYRNNNNDINFVRCTGSEENGIFTMTATGNDMYFWYTTSTGSAYDSTKGQLFKFVEDNYTMTITNSIFNNNYVTYYDEDKISLGYVSKTSNTFVINRFDKSPSAKYFSVRIGYGSATSGQTYTTSIQLEKGNQATTYSPYFTPIDLCKIGNYQDIIFKNTTNSVYYDNTLTLNAWYKKANIDKIVLDENTSFYNDTVPSGNPRKYITTYRGLIVTPANNDTVGQGFANIGIVTATQTYNGTKRGIAIHPNGSLYVDGTTYSNLANTPITLYVLLVTPTYTEITNTTLINQLESIKSKENSTNITISGNLPMIINASALEKE